MENESAKEIYDMGKRLCELAESMGYEDDAGEGEMESAPEAAPAPMMGSKKPAAKKGKLELALGFLK